MQSSTANLDLILMKSRLRTSQVLFAFEKLLTPAEDYYTLFKGNIDEDFRIGLRIVNKALSVFTDYYKSDIVITSPLGLRRIVGSTG